MNQLHLSACMHLISTWMSWVTYLSYIDSWVQAGANIHYNVCAKILNIGRNRNWISTRQSTEMRSLSALHVHSWCCTAAKSLSYELKCSSQQISLSWFGIHHVSDFRVPSLTKTYENWPSYRLRGQNWARRGERMEECLGREGMGGSWQCQHAPTWRS